MPLKRFDGWEPKTTTKAIEWRDGQPAAWETTSEPEWDTRERSLMLALAYWEAGLCKRCGEHLSRGMDPMTDPDSPEADHRWVAEGPDECHCCKALVRAEKKWADDAPDSAPYSVFTPALVPTTPRVRRKR